MGQQLYQVCSITCMIAYMCTHSWFNSYRTSLVLKHSNTAHCARLLRHVLLDDRTDGTNRGNGHLIDGQDGGHFCM